MVEHKHYYINNFIEKVQNVLKGIIETSSQNSVISDELAKTAHHVEKSSELENIELDKNITESYLSYPGSQACKYEFSSKFLNTLYLILKKA